MQKLWFQAKRTKKVVELNFCVQLSFTIIFRYIVIILFVFNFSAWNVIKPQGKFNSFIFLYFVHAEQINVQHTKLKKEKSNVLKILKRIFTSCNCGLSGKSLKWMFWLTLLLALEMWDFFEIDPRNLFNFFFL